MIAKTVVFLSYKHDDRELKEKIETTLTGLCKNANFISDKDIPLGHEIHIHISEMIDKCDIMIPIITRNWLKSHETRDESIRAHDRKRKILPLVKQPEANEQQIISDELPYFMREPLKMHYRESDLQKVLGDLANDINCFDNHWLKSAVSNLTQITEILSAKRRLHTRNLAYAAQEIESLKNDLDNVFNKDRFEKNVSYESNFLIQATPFFETAKKIYAVSFVKISSFWLSESTKNSVRVYLEKQSKNDKPIFRLFVFDTPDEANFFKNVLGANNFFYGRNGGVYLCSADHYRILINHLDGDVDSRMKNDFGLLEYEDGTLCEATLDPKNFIIGKYDLNSPERFYRNFKGFIDRLLIPLNNGKYYENFIKNQHFKVFKWSDDFISDNSDKWAKVLKGMFTERYGKLTHVVLFKVKGNKPQVFDQLLRLKQTLNELKTQVPFQMLSIDVLTKLEKINAVDGRFLSHLEVCKKFDFAIIEIFSNKYDLEKYYSNEVHSDERLSLYQIVNPDIAPLCDEVIEALSLNPELNDRDKIRNLYNKIETGMSEYMMRLDFQDELPIDYIADQDGAEFNIINWL